MMLHKKSNRTSLLKLFVLIPIVGLALALNAKTVTNYVYDEPQKQQPVKKGQKAGTIKMGNQEIKVVEQNQAQGTFTPAEQNTATGTFTPAEEEKAFDVVEEMPEFPGGPKALMDYLAKSVSYPKQAFDADIEGRVIAQFIVDKEGTVRSAHVVKSVDPALDNEAVRVINAMPKWTPGRQNGKAVNVKYTIPVSFRLQGDDKPQAEGSFTPQAEGSFTPHAEGNIQIRYAGTTKEPLFIVDGVKTSAEKVKAMDAKTIERMEVLKDKAAIEKYGDEAQSGVILITTKK